MRKFTAQQLSRILGEHERGGLNRFGCAGTSFPRGGRVCVNQAAYLEPSCADAVGHNWEASVWFDEKYDPKWTTEQFLAELGNERLA